MKKILILFGLFILVLSGAFFYIRKPCSGYSCLSFENKSKYKEIERVEMSVGSYKGMLKYDDIEIRLESYTANSQETATRFVQAKVMQLLGLFEIARSPYPGALSNEVVCEDRFKPQIWETKVNGIQMTLMKGFLNDRLQYGSCLEDQIAYLGETSMVYCTSQNRWYYFEVITKSTGKPLDREINHLIQSLKCQNSF